MKVRGQIERALRSLLESRGIIDYGAYGHLIQHFTDHALPTHTLQLHTRIVVFSVRPNNFLASKLINSYSKQNRLRQARHLFDEIPNRNTFSHNALLIAYTSRDMWLDALAFVSSWLRSSCYASGTVLPDCISVSCVLKALSDCFSRPGFSAREVHGFVLRCGFDFDVFVGNGLVTCYSKCGDIVSAKKVFDEMPSKDIVSWNSMIAGYSQCGFYEECKELCKKMLGYSSLRPNGVTLVSVLQACGQSTDLVFGMELHKYMLENPIQLDVSVCNVLIGFYAKCGSLDYARALFDEMIDKDSVSYGAIISGYMAHGFAEEAVKLFKQLENPGLSTWNAVISGLEQNNQHEVVIRLFREMQESGFRPNCVTLSSVLPSFSYHSNLKGGKEIHAYAIRNGYDDNIYVSTSIIDNYAKLGFLRGAQGVFDSSKDRSLVIWTAIISAYAAHGDANKACSLFYQMHNSCIRPDEVTFTAVLSACAHSGEVDKAHEIFDSMLVKYGVEPSIEHYACMVGALSRTGKLSEAAEFISNMPIAPSAKVWGALLNGASIRGDVELGEFVCDRLFEIEPENTGNYIIMANLYSQAGRWEEADIVRDKMKKIGLKKIPGGSWIETGRGIRSFIAKDASCDRSEEIHAMLEGLPGLMREEGHVREDEFDEENILA